VGMLLRRWVTLLALTIAGFGVLSGALAGEVYATQRGQVDLSPCPSGVACDVTLTPTATATDTLTPTAEPTQTETLTPTPTASAEPSATPLPTETPTATPLPIPTNTPTARPTSTPMLIATAQTTVTPLVNITRRIYLPLLARIEPPFVSPPPAASPTLAPTMTAVPTPIATATVALEPTATAVVIPPTATQIAVPPPSSGEKPWCPVPPSTGFGRRTGAICNDGTTSTATGSGACSRHGGVRCWIGAP
jgi:hypothetical protein